MRKLGSTQKDVLSALVRHGSWSYHSGWYWDTFSNTHRHMERLVVAGAATKSFNEDLQYYEYHPTDEGKAAVGEEAVRRGEEAIAIKRLHRKWAKEKLAREIAAKQKNDDEISALLGIRDRLREHLTNFEIEALSNVAARVQPPETTSHR